jgi:hypothetical protein
MYFSVFLAMPKLSLNSLRSTPIKGRRIEDTEHAGTLVVQFADGTKADTGVVMAVASDTVEGLSVSEFPSVKDK